MSQQELRELAALTVLQSAVAQRISTLKAGLGGAVLRGSLYCYATDDQSEDMEVGRFTRSKPRQPTAHIVDEEAAIVWLLGNFGDDGLVQPALTPQGRKTVIEAFKRGSPVPGVDLSTPGEPTNSWVPSKNAPALVEQMYRDGTLLPLKSLIALEDQ